MRSDLESSPNKKGKIDDSKGKKVMPPPEVKKTKSNKGASRDPKWLDAGKGTSTKPGDVMVSAAVVKKILARMILPVDREKVNKLSLDQVVSKLLHILR